MPFAPIWEAHEIAFYIVQVFHVSWKNSSALWLQLLLSSSVKAEFQKGLCLVSNGWKKSSLLLLKILSSFPNSFCVKQKMCLSSRGGSSYAMPWLQWEFAEKCSLSGIQAEHSFTWVTCTWKGRTTEGSHVPCVSAPCLGMHMGKAWVNLKVLSFHEIFPALCTCYSSLFIFH